MVWALAASPIVFGLCRAPRKVFLSVTSAVAVLGLLGWIAQAGFGYEITENMTTSLNGHIYLIQKNKVTINKGDLIAFHWRGGASYPAGTTFIKRVMGMQGDIVKQANNNFWVGNKYIGFAKPKSLIGVPLVPASEGVIPEDQYFVATPSPDSLDSRYALCGNVKKVEIIGKAYEIF